MEEQGKIHVIWQQQSDIIPPGLRCGQVDRSQVSSNRNDQFRVLTFPIFEGMVADQEIADILGCQVTEPFLCERVFIRFASGKPLQMVNYYLRGDSYKLRFDIRTDNFDFSAFEDQ